MKIASKRTENTNRRAAVGAERKTNKGFGFTSTRRLAFFCGLVDQELGRNNSDSPCVAPVFHPLPFLNVTALTAAINSSLI